MLNKFENLIAKSVNGDEILVSLIPSKRMQSTRQGFTWVEVGKKVLLQSGMEVDLNLDGRSFFTGLHDMFKLEQRVS